MLTNKHRLLATSPWSWSLKEKKNIKKEFKQKNKNFEKQKVKKLGCGMNQFMLSAYRLKILSYYYLMYKRM